MLLYAVYVDSSCSMFVFRTRALLPYSVLSASLGLWFLFLFLSKNPQT